MSLMLAAVYTENVFTIYNSVPFNKLNSTVALLSIFIFQKTKLAFLLVKVGFVRIQFCFCFCF
ncbi:hypothetical protein BDF14DRAFT_8236 [Spinellus fusiger]|nr:hypothetical protein BDF14DRAFT_8236 [Spinellus fusiger]